MDRTLLSFANDVYFLEQELRPATRAFYKLKIIAFGRYLGRTAMVSDLNAATINRFILHRLEERSRETVRGERATLLALWQKAFDIGGHTDDRPGRVRSISKNLPPVVGWSLDELRNLLAIAGQMRGCCRDSDVQRADLFTAVILALYQSGLRLGDLRALGREDLAAREPFAVTQQKTGKPIVVNFQPSGWDAIAKILRPGEQKPFAARHNKRNFTTAFAALCKQAGLVGRTKMLRRMSGSVVEAMYPGEGHTKLGNTEHVFDQYYNIQKITRRDTRLPPELGTA